MPPCSIFLPYPPGYNASNVYTAYGFDPTTFSPPQPAGPFDCPTCTNATHYLWGLSTNIIDWNALKDSSQFGNLTDKGYL